MNVSIDLVFKIAAIGILVAVLYQLLVRTGREDIATMVSIAGAGHCAFDGCGSGRAIV